MALSGNLTTMPLAEVLQFLGTARKTGILRVECAGFRKDVVVDAGDVVFCSTGRPKEMLGHLLVARTGVTEDDLHRAFVSQGASGRRLGEILLDDGRLAPAELDHALQRKTEQSLWDVFTWRAGRFEYHEQRDARRRVPHGLDLSWQDALTEGARHEDAHALVERAIPSRDARFQVAWDVALHRVGDEPLGRELLALLDRGLSARATCERLHEPDLEVLSRLARLIDAGAVRVVDPGSAPPPRTTATDVVEEVARLLHAGDDLAALESARRGARAWPDEARMADCLHAARQVAGRRAEATLGDLSARPTMVASREQLDEIALSPREEAVLDRVNGAWSLSSVARIVPFDEVEALAGLARLFRRGALALSAPRARRSIDVPAVASTTPTPAPVIRGTRPTTLVERVLAAQRRRLERQKQEAEARAARG